jgi:hypothetical protein
VADVNPRAMRRQGSGDVLAQLMALGTIPAEDRQPIYELLARDRLNRNLHREPDK